MISTPPPVASTRRRLRHWAAMAGATTLAAGIAVTTADGFTPTPAAAQSGADCDVTGSFGTPGSIVPFVVPAEVGQLVVEVYGAEGGRQLSTGAATYGVGGRGGLVETVLPVTPGETLNLVVGGQGGNVPGTLGLGATAGPGGFNGGGAGGAGPTVTGGGHGGAGGGGASEIRRGGNVLVIAGGGGGGSHGGNGGHGGQNGQAGAMATGHTAGATPGGGATQANGGSAGSAGTNGLPGTAGVALIGGDGGASTTTTPDSGGGGGGGLYGGGGGGGAHGTAQGSGAPGGGGSSWSSQSATYTTGANADNGGNGLVRITYTDPDCTDLGIGKGATITDGRTIEYTITATNHGPNDATGVTVTDDLPAEVDYVADTCGATHTNGTWTWTIGALDDGDHRSCVITVQATTSGSIANTAGVSGDQRDPNRANDGDAASVNIPESVDVAVLITASPVLVRQGDTVDYTVTVTNHGLDDALDVVVTNDLPGGVSYVGDTCGGSLPDWSWTIPSLAVGASETCVISVEVTAAAPATIVNPVQVATHASQPDTNLANNEDDVTIQVRTLVDLVLDNSVTPTTAEIGDEVVFTLVITNNGPDVATGVVVENSLPAAVRHRSDTCAGTGTTPWTWTIGTLAVGASATCEITVEIVAAGQIVGTATVSANESETTTANNVDTAAVTVAGAAQTGTTTTSTTASTTSTTTGSTSPTTVASGGLPITGTGTGQALLVALVLVVAGGSLLLIVRPFGKSRRSA